MTDFENTYNDEGFPLWLRGSVRYNGDTYVSTQKRHPVRVTIRENSTKTYIPDTKKRPKKRKKSDPLLSQKGKGEYYL